MSDDLSLYPESIRLFDFNPADFLVESGQFVLPPNINFLRTALEYHLRNQTGLDKQTAMYLSAVYFGWIRKESLIQTPANFVVELFVNKDYKCFIKSLQILRDFGMPIYMHKLKSEYFDSYKGSWDSCSLVLNCIEATEHFIKDALDKMSTLTFELYESKLPAFILVNGTNLREKELPKAFDVLSPKSM